MANALDEPRARKKGNIDHLNFALVGNYLGFTSDDDSELELPTLEVPAQPAWDRYLDPAVYLKISKAPGADPKRCILTIQCLARISQLPVRVEEHAFPIYNPENEDRILETGSERTF